MRGIVADAEVLEMQPFSIPCAFVNLSEDFARDGDGDLFVLVSHVDRGKPGAPKNVVIFKQLFDGSLNPRPVLELTSKQSYLGGHFFVGSTGKGLVRVVGLDRVVYVHEVPGFVPFSSTQGAPLVLSLSLLVPWVVYGPPFPAPVFRKTRDGMVAVQGAARGNGATLVGSLVATLPPGYRPDARLSFSVNAGQNWITSAGRLDVLEDGQMLSMTAHANWISFANIVFFGGM